jgi:RNA polymerase sigma-70 factor (ECF subfamily)
MFGIKWFGDKEEKWSEFELEAMPHATDLYRVAMWLTRNQDEAEDLVQETMMQALKSFHRYESGTNCRAWLTTILYHLNSKRLQKLGRMTIVDDPDDLIFENIAFEPPISQRITDEFVIQSLKNLPEKFSQVVVLADVEEYSYKEVAAILGVPIGTVMSRLSRARKLLRVELADYSRQYGFNQTNSLAKAA